MFSDGKQTTAIRRIIRRPSLQATTVALFFFLCAFGSEWNSYRTARRVLHQTVDQQLLSVAQLAGQRLDVARHATLTQTNQQNGEAYLAVISPFREMLKACPDIKYIYTVRASPEGPRFAVDAAQPLDLDKDGVIDQATLNELYDDPDEAMLEALSKKVAAVSKEPFTDKWGTFISSFVPAFRPDGEMECIIGVDMTAEHYLSKVNQMQAALRVGLAGALLGSLLIGILVYWMQNARHRSHAALELNETRFRQFFELGIMGMAITSPNKGWIEVNQSLCAMFQLSRTELLKSTWADLTHPDDLPADIANFERVIRGEADGYFMEKRFFRANKTVFTAEFSVRCVRRKDGTIDHFVALVADITERKQAEQRLLTALRQSESVLWTISSVAGNPALAQGNVPALATSITELAAETIGVDRVSVWLYEESSEQLRCLDLFEQQTRNHSSSLILRKKDFGPEFEAMERSKYIDAHDALNDPRTHGYVETYLRPFGIKSMLDVVIRTSGRIRGLICFEQVQNSRHWEPHEIAFACQLADQIGIAILNSEQRLASDELVRARDAAQAASRAKSEFLATMSHEIRTPMNGVIGFTDLLMASPLNQEQQSFTTTIKDSASCLLTLIDDILDFSKIEAGKLTLEHAPFNARDVTVQVLELLSTKASKEDIELILDWDSLTPSEWIGDISRFRQVLLNLVGNAIKFTLKGHVLVRARREDGGCVKIEIIDTGIGIPADVLPLLFRKFTQADSSNSRKFGGTGLGLAICKQLVELAGGKIDVASEEGKGSTFWFTHPIPVGTPALPRVVDSPFSTAARVLLIDANAIRREVFERQFSEWKCDFRSSESRAATDHLLNATSAPGQAFDLVLVDYAVAGPDPAELARALRQSARTQNARLALLAPSTLRTNTANRDIAYGFDTVLWKPVLRPENLAESIQKLFATAPLAQKEAAASPSTARANRRVLVVDQARTNQVLADRLLRRAGFEVDLADTGHKAAELAARQQYDLILLDWHLPELNGRDTTAAIRSIEQNSEGGSASRRAPIIALVDELWPELQSEASTAGVDDFLAKPLNPAAIGDLLSRWAA